MKRGWFMTGRRWTWSKSEIWPKG